MRFVIFLTLSVLTVLINGAPQETSDSTNGKPQYNLEDAECLFEEFIEKYNKVYKDDADKQIHYEQFVKSLKKINELNADPDNTATFDINKFADYTEEQWSKMRGLKTN